jgi:GDP-4-dehydro-6-deoxy-D-mannose reductase
MKRVAVFGIAGFSGRHFERFVASEGLGNKLEFFGFGRDLSRAEHSGIFSYREGDACEDNEVLRFVDEIRPAYVLNLTGIFRAESFEKFVAVNVGVSRAICEGVQCSDPDIQKIVFVGSAAEYGSTVANPVKEDADARPISQYGLSKLYQTLLSGFFFRNYGLPTVVARTFNILGEGLSPELSIGNFMKQIAALPEGGTIKVGNVSTSRDFLQISEVSRRYWNLLMQGVPGEVYNVCSGEPRTIRSVLEDLIRESGKTLSIETDPLLFKGKDIALIYGDSTKYDQLVRLR